MARLLDTLVAEHQNIYDAMAEITLLAHHAVLPVDECPVCAEISEGMRMLELNINQHTHLENNILFPRVYELANITSVDDGGCSHAQTCGQKHGAGRNHQGAEHTSV